jgi:hypothetical protein
MTVTLIFPHFFVADAQTMKSGLKASDPVMRMRRKGKDSRARTEEWVESERPADEDEAKGEGLSGKN